jgi:glycosyltransferase involved in cell wall biosynthesis
MERLDVSEAPRVSVTVPCYNLGDYVLEAIESVLSQSFGDLEIIVVNDGSTDPHTNAVLRELQRPRTTVLTTANRGLPAARNHAIQHARGTYVCALDADDRLHPQFLEKTIAVLDRDPSVAFVSTWVECFGTENWVWRQHECAFPRLLAECVVLTASPVRREAIDAVGGYDAHRNLYGIEDWDLWISLVEKGYRGTIIPEVLFYYRQREGSMRRVAEGADIRIRGWRTLLDKHRESYERFLSEVLLLKEDGCGRLLLDNWTLQHDLHTRLEPLLAEKAAERDRLVTDLQRLPDITAADRLLEEERAAGAQHLRQLDAARAEIAALRSSSSWKLTAPLRKAYDGWTAARRLLGALQRGSN